MKAACQWVPSLHLRGYVAVLSTCLRRFCASVAEVLAPPLLLSLRACLRTIFFVASPVVRQVVLFWDRFLFAALT